MAIITLRIRGSALAVVEIQANTDSIFTRLDAAQWLAEQLSADVPPSFVAERIDGEARHLCVIGGRLLQQCLAEVLGVSVAGK